MKGNQKLRKLLFAFFVIGMTTFPSTFAKFTHKEDGALVYQSQTYSLYSELNMTLMKAEQDTAHLRLSFVPSEITKRGEVDTYLVTLPTGCSFEKTETVASVTGSAEERTFRFAGDIDRKKTSYIYIACPVVPKNNQISYTAKITTTLYNAKEEKMFEFAYMKYHYLENYTTYQAKVNKKIDEQTTFPAEGDLYTNFKNWVIAYADTTSYPTTVKRYVFDAYPDIQSLQNAATQEQLPGFTIRYEDSSDEYTFEIVDNFVGYARTYTDTANPTAEETFNFYFSTSSANAIDEAFTYYLRKYVYNNEEAIQDVFDYVQEKGRVSSVLNGGTLSGLSLVKNDEGAIRLYRATLLSLALSNKLGNDDIIIVNTSADTMASIVSNGLLRSFSRAEATAIYMLPGFKASATKKWTTPFTDYFVYKTGADTKLIKIVSDTIDEYPCNRVVIESIPLAEGVSLTTTNTDTELTVTITSTNKEDALSALLKVNTYFQTTHEENDLEANAEGKYVITYTISK